MAVLGETALGECCKKQDGEDSEMLETGGHALGVWASPSWVRRRCGFSYCHHGRGRFQCRNGI